MIEKVNPSHPDKVADRIAGALVDMAYQMDENPKIAVEVLIGHSFCNIIAETSEVFNVSDVHAVVNRISGNIYFILYCNTYYTSYNWIYISNYIRWNRIYNRWYKLF